MTQLLWRIPGVRVYDTTGHLTFSAMVEVCRKEGIPVPPAIVFIRNPWSWHVSRWSWMVQQDHFEGSFADYLTSIDQGTGGTKVYRMINFWGYMGGDNAQYIGRFEQYTDEIVRILLAIMPTRLSASRIRNTLEGLGKMRQATEGSYRDYYDGRLRRLVAKFDQLLIRKFSYTF